MSAGMQGPFSFEPVVTEELDLLRVDVRNFLADNLPVDHEPGLGMSSGHSPTFSKLLANRGWVGMAIPAKYGGHGCTALERFVVCEELLAAGAPIAAHWTADRQTAPMILRYGTEEQRVRFLPTIASGDCWFSLGMSEPDAGSDLASVRTAAVREDNGWRITGRKIWMTYAHLNHYAVMLCRTSPADGDRHSGLSQFIVDLRAPGVHIASIPFIDGTRDFCEVTLDDVFVDDGCVLGRIGEGWRQVSSELAHERGGPDRYLSTWQVLEQFVGRCDSARRADPHVQAAIGALVARFVAVRHMSLAVYKAFGTGQTPAGEAALVKDLGTTLEQHLLDVVRELLDDEQAPEGNERFERLLARATLNAPSFTIRGGTSEVLRGIAAKRMAQ